MCFEKLISSAVILFPKPTKLKSVNTIKLAVLNIELRVFCCSCMVCFIKTDLRIYLLAFSVDMNWRCFLVFLSR